MSIEFLSAKIERSLNIGNIDYSLSLIHGFVERVITEPVCVAQIFSSFELDQFCLRIGRQNLAKLQLSKDNQFSNAKKSSTVVYIVSRLQRSGGHSRLVQDFIRAQPKKKHLILSTEIGGPSDVEFYSKNFAKYKNVQFLRDAGGNFEARLKWLQSTILTILPEHVYLFNHHQDSVAAAALVPELNIAGSFCHHGDHHLCLGVHLNHLTHIDIHPMGFHHCRDKLGVNNRYLPLTFEDKGHKTVDTDFMHSGGLVTATAAGWNKIEIPYYVSYLDVIPRLIETTGGRHLHIGKLTPWALLRIHGQMKKLGVAKDRFVYVEWTSSVWKALQEHKVDIYIASFPYGAGLTLIEAMGAGVPVIMHEHMYARVLSGLELAYPEAYSWSDPSDLIGYIKTLTPSQLMLERSLSREQYEKFHKSEILEKYFKAPEHFEIDIPPLSLSYKPNLDLWASWVVSQFSISNIIFRYAYRLVRKIRRWAFS